MTGAVVPIKRTRRKGPAQVGNVVPLHAKKGSTKTEDIVREVQERSQRKSDDISAMLQDLNRQMDVRHMERAKELLPIGYAMCRPELDDLIEIGRRMLAAKGGRGR
jgi:hypothetical protein